MKNHYDFEQQIKSLNDIGQTNIDLAQIANQYLKTMPQSFIKKAVQQLKVEYEQEFLKDNDKISVVYSTLNLIQREKVTNIDELFIDLAEEINNYYGEKKLILQKKSPYLMKCIKCQRYVSNYSVGLKCHQARCHNQVINKKKRKKIADTEQKYQKRQALFNETAPNQIKKQHLDKKLSKKQKLALKTANKVSELIGAKHRISQDNNSNEHQKFYFEDNDQDQRHNVLVNHQPEIIQQSTFSSLNEISILQQDQEDYLK